MNILVLIKFLIEKIKTIKRSTIVFNLILILLFTLLILNNKSQEERDSICLESCIENDFDKGYSLNRFECFCESNKTEDIFSNMNYSLKEW